MKKQDSAALVRSSCRLQRNQTFWHFSIYITAERAIG